MEAPFRNPSIFCGSYQLACLCPGLLVPALCCPSVLWLPWEPNPETNLPVWDFFSFGSVPWSRSSCAGTTGRKKRGAQEKRGTYKPAFTTLLPGARTLSQALLDPTQLSVLPRNQNKQIGKVSMKFKSHSSAHIWVYRHFINGQWIRET